MFAGADLQVPVHGAVNGSFLLTPLHFKSLILAKSKDKKSTFICHSGISVLRNIRNPADIQGKHYISFLWVLHNI